MTPPPDPTPSARRPSQPWWAARGPSAAHVAPAAVRIGNAERAQVTDDLCRHFADGRLDEAELEERMARAAAAKTRADLAPLLADLPSLAGPPATESTRSQSPRPHGRAVAVLLAVALTPFLLAGVLAVGIGALGMARGALHALFPLLVVVVVIAFASRRRGQRHHHHHPPEQWR